VSVRFSDTRRARHGLFDRLIATAISVSSQHDSGKPPPMPYLQAGFLAITGLHELSLFYRTRLLPSYLHMWPFVASESRFIIRK
jgi:hypothetical protein